LFQLLQCKGKSYLQQARKSEPFQAMSQAMSSVNPHGGPFEIDGTSVIVKRERGEMIKDITFHVGIT
jgi:hypothetical protein